MLNGWPCPLAGTVVSLFILQVAYVSTGHVNPEVKYTTYEVIQRISRKLLRMDVLTSETC